MTEVTPNLPHCGNFCKYCFMGTLLYGENAFYSAWQDAMYSDVYRCWGRYGYLVAWEQFGDYLDFYEGIFGSERLKDYDSIYNDAPTGMETDDEAGYYVDEVLALAEKNNADMIFN